MVDIEHDFTVLSDGGLPHPFGTAILQTDIGGDEVVAEPFPDTYFFIDNERAVFKYFEDVIGGVLQRHGLLSSPGVLQSTDVKLSCQFYSPLEYFDPSSIDLFVFQIGMGFRNSNLFANWVGGMLTAIWTPLGWNPKFNLAVVEVLGTIINELSTFDSEALFLENNELIVQIQGKNIKTSFNGVKIVEDETEVTGENGWILWTKLYTELNGIKTPIAVVHFLGSEELRTGKHYAIREFPTQFLDLDLHAAHGFLVPVDELRAIGAVRQIGPEIIEFTKDIVVNEGSLQEFKAVRGSTMTLHRRLLSDFASQVGRFRYF